MVHATADIASTVATVLAFGWLYMGLGRIASRRGAAGATLAIGIARLALTLVTGVSYLSADWTR
jgi:hypothetical protein